jgi:transcriptional regulator with XRE-family HTH domain/tetratricopeptide (TPR) repeat protein
MAMLKPSPFGSFLKRHRTAANFTQEELAERAGMSVRAISALENGQRRAPYRQNLVRLADALDLQAEFRGAFLSFAHGAKGARTGSASGSRPRGSYLGAVPIGSLVSRQNEVAQIIDALDAARSGQGRTVFLSGEPGVGKTRLAQCASQEAIARTFLVAAGRCYEPEAAVPFYPFLEALAFVYEKLPASLREDLTRQWLHVAWLLPDYALMRPVADEGPEAQQRLLRAVAGFLRTVAQHTPVALLLDDLQWADRSSLHLLRHLTHHVRDAPIFLLGTYRDVEVDESHPLHAALLDLDHERLSQEIELKGLQEEDAAELMSQLLGGAEVPAALAAEIHRGTGGNALFIQEMTLALVERGHLLTAGDSVTDISGEIEVPSRVRSVIRERVARLGSRTQEVLEAASVLGQTFDANDLEMMIDRPSDLDDAIEAASHAGLVREMGGDRYSFQHALMQQSLYSSLSARRRRTHHAAAARAIERLSAQAKRRRAVEIAAHYQRAHMQREALPYLLQAAASAEEVSAYDEAEQNYRAVVKIARQCEAANEEALALLRIGWILRTVGRYVESLETLDQAASLYGRIGDLDGEAETMSKIGWTLSALGQMDTAIARLKDLAARLESADRPFPGLLPLYDALAHLLMREGHFSEWNAVIQRASEISEALSNSEPSAMGELNRALGLMGRGDTTGALPALNRAAHLAEAAADADTAIRALVFSSHLSYCVGDQSMAGRHCDRAVELAEKTGNPNMMVFAIDCLGELRFYLGDWKGARATYERADCIGRPCEPAFFSLWPIEGLFELDLLEGKCDDALRRLHRLAALTESSGGRTPALTLEILRAQYDMARGQPTAAIERLQPLLADLLTVPTESGLSAGSRYLAEAYALGHMGEHANDMVMRGCEWERQARNLLEQSRWLRIQSMLHATRHEWGLAEDACRSAALVARAVSYPHGEALAMRDHGLILLRVGRELEAQELLRRAETICRRLGALPDLQSIELALAATNA